MFRLFRKVGEADVRLYTLVTSDWLTGGAVNQSETGVKIRQEPGDLCVGPLRRTLEPNLDKCSSRNRQGF